MNEGTYHVYDDEMEDCSLCNLYSWEDYQRSIYDAEIQFKSKIMPITKKNEGVF